MTAAYLNLISQLLASTAVCEYVQQVSVPCFSMFTPPSPPHPIQTKLFANTYSRWVSPVSACLLPPPPTHTHRCTHRLWPLPPHPCSSPSALPPPPHKAVCKYVQQVSVPCFRLSTPPPPHTHTDFDPYPPTPASPHLPSSPPPSPPSHTHTKLFVNMYSR